MHESDDSPYTDSNTAHVISPLDGKLMQSMNQDVTDNAACAGTGGRPDPACKRKLQTWWNYFTKLDWLIFNDPAKSFHCKMEIATHRARSLGYVEPDEQSIKWMLAILLKCHFHAKQTPSALQKHINLNVLKGLFTSENSCRKDIDFSLILSVYPKDPSDLPSSVYNACYANEPPVNMTEERVAGVSKVATSIPLRKNNALLKDVPPHEFDTMFGASRGTNISRSSSNLGEASSSADKLKINLANVTPHTQIKVEPECAARHALLKYNYCPACGRDLCQKSGGCTPPSVVKDDPDAASESIKQKLRVSGMPSTTTSSAPPVELPAAAPSAGLHVPAADPAAREPPGPPQLDEHA